MGKSILNDRISMRKMLMVVTLLFLASCQKLDTWLQDNGFDDKGSSQALHLKADVAHDWFNLQIGIILYNPPATPNTGRAFAYSGIILYEAVRSGIPKSISLSESLVDMPTMPSADQHQKYSLEVAANAALAAATRYFFTGMTDANKLSVDSLEKAYNDRLKNDCKPDVFKRSQELGWAVASAVSGWSLSDKFDHAGDAYTRPDFLGAWEPTPLGFAPALLPYAGNCRPFLQSHSSGLADPPPFAYSEDVKSDYYKMVRDIYDVSKNLTDEQRNLALFFNDVGAGRGYSPQGHAVSILNQLIVLEHINLGLAAEAFAKMGMGLWDGQVLTWRSKYKYNQMRPVTYIQRFIDASWLPLINTPAHPEYPAAHAYVTSTAMAALGAVLGDKHTFTDHTYDFLGLTPLQFTSLLDVGRASGNSRRYGGIHYLPSINTGIKLGQAAGKEIGKIKMVKGNN